MDETNESEPATQNEAAPGVPFPAAQPQLSHKGDWFRSAKRDKRGHVLPKDRPPEEPVIPSPPGSTDEMMAEVLGGLGGWKRACRMYANAIRRGDKRRIDALRDLFRILLSDKAKRLDADGVQTASDADLAKIVARALGQKGG